MRESCALAMFNTVGDVFVAADDYAVAPVLAGFATTNRGPGNVYRFLHNPERLAGRPAKEPPPRKSSTFPSYCQIFIWVPGEVPDLPSGDRKLFAGFHRTYQKS